jgi:hypothetical protein
VDADPSYLVDQKRKDLVEATPVEVAVGPAM